MLSKLFRRPSKTVPAVNLEQLDRDLFRILWKLDPDQRQLHLDWLKRNEDAMRIH